MFFKKGCLGKQLDDLNNIKNIDSNFINLVEGTLHSEKDLEMFNSREIYYFISKILLDHEGNFRRLTFSDYLKHPILEEKYIIEV